jgi:hypothetical protein
VDGELTGVERDLELARQFTVDLGFVDAWDASE